MTYRNPWAKPHESQVFETDSTPILHAGAEIYKHSSYFDVVKAGTCITERGSIEEAKRCAEVVSDLLCPTYQDVRERMLAKYGRT